MSNVYSIQQTLKFLGVNSIYTANHSEILAADKIILPGVGAYARAVKALREMNLFETLHTAVLEKNIPILGICLGMQLLAKSSDEGGYTTGLGLYNGEIRKFDKDKENIKIPHVGFNLVKKPNESVLYKDMAEYSDFYFTHSYRLIMHEENSNFQGLCHYGEEFIASFEKGHIFGVQFHPEKSQNNGLRLLKNFIEYETC